MVSLVCIDVDGTLVGASGAVAPEVWEAAERARARGIELAVCSGRPAFGSTRGYAERLGAGWHIFQNGASVMNVRTGESRSTVLSPDGERWLREAAAATGRTLELYTDFEYAVEHDTDRTRRHAGLLGVPFRLRPFSSLTGPIVRAQWLLSHEEAEPVLRETHPDLHYSLSHSPVMEDTAFVNITPAGVDKASALRVLATAYGVPLERVMMVGDGLNDVGAMRSVGHPVAMGNAEPEARAVGRYQVAHVDEHGLAEALDLAVRIRDGSPASAA